MNVYGAGAQVAVQGASAAPLTSEMFAGSDIGVIRSIELAKTTWLRPQAVSDMLLNAPTLSTVVISDVPPELPESGTMYLFNKAKTKRWRNDKHKWQRRGSRLNEHHENLKVRGTEVLNACYCRREEVSTFRRRAYWLLQPLIDARLEQLEDRRKEAQQALQQAEHQEMSLMNGNQEGAGIHIAGNSVHLLSIQRRVESARQTLALFASQKQQYESLSGLVLVHYLDEAVPAALILQKNVRAMINNKRTRTESPQRGPGSDEMDQLHFADKPEPEEELELLDHHGELLDPKFDERYATLLQAHYRGKKVRKKVEEEAQMSTVLQKHMRGHFARKDLARRNEASHVLGRHVRGHLVRRDLAIQDAASQVIGRHVRNHLSRKHQANENEADGAACFKLDLPNQPIINIHQMVDDTTAVDQGVVEQGLVQRSSPLMESEPVPGPMFGSKHTLGGHAQGPMFNTIRPGAYSGGPMCAGATEPFFKTQAATSPSNLSLGSLDFLSADLQATGMQGETISPSSLGTKQSPGDPSGLGAQAFGHMDTIEPLTSQSIQGVQVQALQAEIAALRAMTEKQENQIRECNSGMRVSKSTISGLEQMLRQKDSSINDLQYQMQQQQATIQALQNQLAGAGILDDSQIDMQAIMAGVQCSPMNKQEHNGPGGIDAIDAFDLSEIDI